MTRKKSVTKNKKEIKNKKNPKKILSKKATVRKKATVWKKTTRKRTNNPSKICLKSRLPLDKIVKSKNVKKLEKDILKNFDVFDLQMDKKSSSEDISNSMEQIVFKVPKVEKQLKGTPKEVRQKLDELVKKIQRNPKDDKSFDIIHCYMHFYLINLALKKFPFIRGFQTVDIYQEALIALRFKAIPSFETGKNMSFLNFAKMCIKRHLITLLHASIHRKKDISMNTAVSLDNVINKEYEDDETKNSFMNFMADNKSGNTCDLVEKNEAYEVTLRNLQGVLSSFEKIVLEEYLMSNTYEEMAENVSKKLRKKYSAKSIDNALLRIRNKASNLLNSSKTENLPIFLL